jgi:DNA (cytosine-5)-methyltransferase 1
MADANHERRDRIDPLLRQDEAGRVKGNLHEAAGHGSGNMADADDAKRRQDGAGGDDNHRDQAGWDQDAGDVGACDEGDVAHTGNDRTRRDAGASGDGRGAAVDAGAESIRQTHGKSCAGGTDARGIGDVADASIIRREERERKDRQQDAGGGSQGRLDAARDGSFWSDHVWLAGSDGKSRRSKPGLPLLAHGIPNRVGRLRAYGNAIVPQVAAEVIKAFMECEP